MDTVHEEQWDGELDSTSELVGNIIFLFFLVLLCEVCFQNISER